MRELREARVRAKPWDSPELLENAKRWHDDVVTQARRPNDQELASSIRHAAFGLCAAVVGP
jgi:hypothetical protein